MSATLLNLDPVVTLTRQQFYDLCAANPDAKLERNVNGALIVMSPTGGETGSWNAEINADVCTWNRRSKKGKVFDSSTGFALPNEADRSPDLAWITLEKWQALSAEERRGFLPLCPDFVVELLSPSDSWKQGLLKMAEYQENGCRLGWLIDPQRKRVAIYRENQPVEILDNPATLSGENVLEGFILNLTDLWENN
jgi:Uma2 family endonuclease